MYNGDKLIYLTNKSKVRSPVMSQKKVIILSTTLAIVLKRNI